MSNTMQMDEITILGVTDAELFAYIKNESLDKEWPVEIVHNKLSYNYKDYWVLPTIMHGGFVKVARYVMSQNF